MSFKYYDPVLIIVKTLMPQVRKQFYGLKNALQLYYANNSVYDQFRKKLGFFPSTKGVIGDLSKGTEKLTYKTESHTNYQEFGINHNTILHEVMTLQISNYICIDENKNPLQMVHRGYVPKRRVETHGNILQ